MDIMELGAIGELVGGAAVIGSLIFVGLQVRQNSRLVTNSVVQATRQATNEYLSALSADPTLSKLYFAGLAGRDTLPIEDRLRFDMILLQVLRLHESLFFEYQGGYLREDIWQCYERAFAPVLKQAGGVASWRRQRTLVTARYADYVDQNLVAQQAMEA